MQPYTNLGIRFRRTKSKGFFATSTKKRNHPKSKVESSQEIPDEGQVAGISDTLKKLLRGNKGNK